MHHPYVVVPRPHELGHRLVQLVRLAALCHRELGLAHLGCLEVSVIFEEILHLLDHADFGCGVVLCGYEHLDVCDGAIVDDSSVLIQNCQTADVLGRDYLKGRARSILTLDRNDGALHQLLNRDGELLEDGCEQPDQHPLGDNVDQGAALLVHYPHNVTPRSKGRRNLGERLRGLEGVKLSLHRELLNVALARIRRRLDLGMFGNPAQPPLSALDNLVGCRSAVQIHQVPACILQV
mmetsp:Transcript_12243/g.30737  ORF Transcript_12243/g.30737 Transcript_12243/m.30737 type:complete len:236 (-) Transcript_12243:290-997(-)